MNQGKQSFLWRQPLNINGNATFTVPGDEPSYAGSNRGRIRGRKIERPLIEVTPGQRSIEGISPLAKRAGV